MNAEIKTLQLADKEQTLRLGADVIRLGDFTSQEFVTTDIEDFLSYVQGLRDTPTASRAVIEYDQNSVKYWASRYPEMPRDEKPLATCKLTSSARLQALQNINGRNVTRDDLESFLRKLADNLDSAGRDLLDSIMDFNVSKVTKIKRSKQPNGNYHYSVTKESAGSDDFVPPKKLSFTVPVFDGIDTDYKFTFEFGFDYVEADGLVALKFKLENLNLDEAIFKARKAIIKTFLESVSEIPAYWGSRVVHLATDEWSFKRNEAK